MANKNPLDFLDRSNKGPPPIYRTILAALRSIDPYIQYLILTTYGRQMFSKFGLASHPPDHGTIFLFLFMTSVCAIKHIINVSYIMEVKISLFVAVIAPISATVFSPLATLSSLYFSPSITTQYIGISLFLVGISVELISELQRKRFKDNSANKGRNYMGGLFSLARHINYGSYAVWRTGLVLTSGNYYLAGALFLLQIWNFTARAVPVLDAHCAAKYGDGWKQYKQDVPYILYPYLWQCNSIYFHCALLFVCGYGCSCGYSAPQVYGLRS
jgi:protein-S-isoprenylcysteine O-methyltransferase Ste14